MGLSSWILTEPQVEIHWRFGRPKPQGIDDIVLVTRNGVVIRQGEDHLSVYPLLAIRGVFNPPVEVDG